MQAFIHAFKEVYDLDTDIDVIAHHGGTDPLILKAVLEHHGRDGTEVMRRLKELEGSMIRFAEANAASAGEGLQTLPGVVDLLQGLKQRPNVLTCLVTGNLEPIGWLKMRHLGLYDCFTAPQFGGFGTDFCSGNSAEMWHDRAEFVRIAGQKADTIASEKGLPAIVRRVHVGDTPFDIKAAVAAGAFALGVTTGVFSRAELEACMDVGRGEGFVLDSLEDLDEVLRVTGCADL